MMITKLWLSFIFNVADVNGPAICGLPTSCKLKLVELHCEITTNTKASCTAPQVNNKGDLQMLYPDRFNGIGKFEGEYHIVTDPNVLPVIHAPRECPIHIKDDIKKELDQMVSHGVIKPVTDASDWVSSAAYSQKSNGRWRVCLDPKPLKEAITILQLLKKSPTNSMAAQYSRNQMPVMATGLYLTLQPIGRFRFTCLPFGLCVSQDIFQQKMDFILEKCPGTVGIADGIAVMVQLKQSMM